MLNWPAGGALRYLLKLDAIESAPRPGAKQTTPDRLRGGLIFGYLAGGVWVLLREWIYGIRAWFASNTLSLKFVEELGRKNTDPSAPLAAKIRGKLRSFC